MLRLFTRGGVEDIRLEAKDTKKSPWPRPRTDLTRTDPFEAKDRNAQDQGLRTQRPSVFKTKKRFSQILLEVSCVLREEEKKRLLPWPIFN